MFFYELHEGDDEVFSDVLLVSESEWEPDEFFELVQSIRRRVQDTYGHDTLIEAIAVELEREHGFIFVCDDRLSPRSTSRPTKTRTSWRDLEVELADAEDDDDDDDDDRRPSRTVDCTTASVDSTSTVDSAASSAELTGRAHRAAYLLNRISTTSPSRTR